MADAAKVCLTSDQKETVNIAKKACKIMITASWAVDLTEDSSRTAHGRALWVRGMHASGFLSDGLCRQWGSVPWEWSPMRPDALLFYPQSSGSHVSQQAIWGERGLTGKESLPESSAILFLVWLSKFTFTLSEFIQAWRFKSQGCYQRWKAVSFL